MVSSLLLCAAVRTALGSAFSTGRFSTGRFSTGRRPATRLAAAKQPGGFELELDLGQGRVLATTVPRTMPTSELVVANYPLPFFIDIEARAGEGNIVTKDGSDQKNKGLERIGDRLRGFTYYAVSQGMEGGPAGMFASFGGASIKYQRMLFDATMVPWETALEKLMTNEPRRTDSVTMIFERPVVKDAAE